MKNNKKLAGRIILICGIVGFAFLLLEALPAFQDFYIKEYPVDFAILVADIVLILAIAILSYLQRFRILTIVLAIILIALLLVKWQATYPPIAIIYTIYSLIIIWFNLHFK